MSPAFPRLCLKVVLLPLLPLSLALANNALSKPLRLKAVVQLGQIRDDFPARLHDRLLGSHGTVGLDAELKRREEGMRHLVCGEHDGGVLEKALREEVAERVVFFVEGEDCGVRDAWVGKWVSDYV